MDARFQRLERLRERQLDRPDSWESVEDRERRRQPRDDRRGPTSYTQLQNSERRRDTSPEYDALSTTRLEYARRRRSQAGKVQEGTGKRGPLPSARDGNANFRDVYPREDSGRGARSPRNSMTKVNSVNADDSDWTNDEYPMDVRKWTKVAQQGELDVYTCLGLSDGCTLSPDTRALILKIMAALCMQLAAPVLMLYLDMKQVNISKEDVSAGEWYSLLLDVFDEMKPAVGGVAFRVIGCSMILYSLYSMYHNALDECRSTLLHFSLKMHLKMGICWPLLLGEFCNLCVALILLLELYFIFRNTTESASLVLNSVAVNFLGNIDAEFVDRDSYVNATINFKSIVLPFRGTPPARPHCWARCVEILISFMERLFVVMGIVLAFVFLLAPSRDGEQWYVGNH